MRALKNTDFFPCPEHTQPSAPSRARLRLDQFSLRGQLLARWPLETQGSLEIISHLMFCFYFQFLVKSYIYSAQTANTSAPPRPLLPGHHCPAIPL
ncbi:predicted protein [Botrytis cinerea T4]|uniref:Uncharacterized protein n=1 Tax=Botryotinia fuckeliana (strain T4) TaxID=999810 RepID=G2Y2P5_BOTF4|nr:predicted protein [Botrytis cinerea T4]